MTQSGEQLQGVSGLGVQVRVLFVMGVLFTMEIYHILSAFIVMRLGLN